MQSLKKISKKDIEDSLKKTNRSYLVGKLQRPQLLQSNFEDTDLGMGISITKDEGGFDEAHYHTTITEFQYVVEGSAVLFDFTNHKTLYVEKGDCYCVQPYCRHIQYTFPNTRVIFVKSQFINDKELYTITPKERKWIDEELKKIQ